MNKPSNTLLSATLALSIALTPACKKATEVTAERVSGTLETKDPIALLVQEYPDIHALLKLVNEGDKTAEYFIQAEKAYSAAGVDSSIAGPRADMRARLLTLADRINSGDITADQLKRILESGVLSYSLPVQLEYPTDEIDIFLKGYGTDVTNASMKGETLTLSRPGVGKSFSIIIK